MRGYDVIRFVGKGGHTYTVPLAVPVSRAVHSVIDGRDTGPILTTSWKTRMTRSAASRMIREIAQEAEVNDQISPHSLRRTFATTASAMGVPLRDIQNTLRHASPSTTGIYIRDGENLDRNSTHQVAAFLSGMAS